MVADGRGGHERLAPGGGADDRRGNLARLTPPDAPGDTIFAVSSGSAPAAIAVVRVSGLGAGASLRTLAGRLPPPRRATLARLTDAEGAMLDRALLLWLPGPDNATGEDLAELHLHGGRATIAAVLAELGRQPGLRPAAPGEFTRRALVNGRVDLAQVEGLGDLLAAETEGQRRAALRQAEGGLGRLIEGWRERLLVLSAEIEAAIEFAEEHEDVPLAPSGVPAAMAELAREIEDALANPPAERLRDGLRVVVAGPVNAGKSSLVNALAEREAAIATPIAGTTRDLIEVPLILGGLPFVLVDSAGLRSTEDAVERIGVARAEQAVAGADILLWLGIPDDAPRGPETIFLHARCDRPDRGERSRPDQLAISTETGEGLDALRARLLSVATHLLPAPNRVALNERQHGLLRETTCTLKRDASTNDETLIAEDLRVARTALDALTGGVGVEDMLDALFGRFCIGK